MFYFKRKQIKKIAKEANELMNSFINTKEKEGFFYKITQIQVDFYINMNFKKDNKEYKAKIRYNDNKWIIDDLKEIKKD